MPHHKSPPVTVPLPFDPDGHSIDVLWSRLSGALWGQRARSASQADDPASPVEVQSVRLSSAELQSLLSLLRERARTSRDLLAKFEAALEAAG